MHVTASGKIFSARHQLKNVYILPFIKCVCCVTERAPAMTGTVQVLWENE